MKKSLGGFQSIVVILHDRPDGLVDERHVLFFYRHEPLGRFDHELLRFFFPDDPRNPSSGFELDVVGKSEQRDR